MTDDLPSLPSVPNKAQQIRLALTRRQQAFVEAYARPGTVNGQPALNATEACRLAGYSHNRANSTAQNLLKNPKVRAAVDAIRAEVAAAASYSVERCMAELEAAMTFAKATDNASAFVRAVELRGRLSGVLVDKLDARVALGGFVLHVHGLHAEAPGG
jgi:hypothetical protein